MNKLREWAVTEAEQRELAEILAEMGYDRASRTWKCPPADRSSLSNAAIGAACIAGACLIAAIIPAPPHLPISLTPFYLGVAGAVGLGAFLRRRNTGWYAFAFVLPAIYLDASVAALVWIALTVAAFAVIASIGNRRELDLGHRPRSRAPSRPLPFSRRGAPPAALYGSTRHA